MSDQAQTARSLPFYRCHKVVQALKIRETQHVDEPLQRKWFIVPEDERFGPIEVPFSYVRRHQPQAGGYFVVYKDGYQSWSPAKEFEEGYTRI